MKKDIVILSVPYMEPIPPMAPVLLSACLNDAGIKSKGLDFNIDFFNHFRNNPSWADIHNLFAIGYATDIHLSKRVLIDILKFTKRYLLSIKEKYDPAYIGLSIFTSESVDFSYILIAYIRKYLPNTKIVLGGRGLENIHAQTGLKHYEMYWQYGLADLLIVGDAETSLIEALQNESTGIYLSKVQTKEDLDKIPSPNWDDYDLSIYDTAISSVSDESRYMGITASKGCVRACTFCDVKNFWPDYIYRDGANVARDIIHNYRSTGIDNFFFTDNLINGSVSNFKKMNEVLAREIPNKINYFGYAIMRPQNQMPEEDFRLAALAGSKKWIIGIESGSEKVRNDMRKKFTNDDIAYTAKQLFKHKIAQSWLFVVGYPSETEEDFIQTLDLLREFSYMGKDKMLRINVTPPYMHTPSNNMSTDPNLARYYGLDSIDFSKDPLSVHFWESTVFTENTFLIRVDRWRRLINLSIELGLTWHDVGLISKWKDEIDGLEKVYIDKYKNSKSMATNETKTKVITIHQVYQ